jgi:hypothetical protein
MQEYKIPTFFLIKAIQVLTIFCHESKNGILFHRLVFSEVNMNVLQASF